MGARKGELRSTRLLEMLRLNQRLDVRTVADSLGISEATVRRLFSRLDREGKVIRIHGGVRPAQHLGMDYSYNLSATHRSREKAAIGAAAAELVSSGDRIFMDSGTTVLKLAEAVSLRLQSRGLEDLVVLTNSLVLVEVLARWCKMLLVGGEVRTERRDVCGPIAEETLRRFHVTRAFFGADALHLRGGFMTTDERSARLNELILRGAERAFVLADAQKFECDSFVSYAALGEVDLVLTDDSIPESTLAAFRDAGATIRVVPTRHMKKDDG